MLYFTYDLQVNLKQVSDVFYAPTNHPEETVLTRNDLLSFEVASNIADDATVLNGCLYIPVDKGQGAYPRFDVIKAPELGDNISKTFNGDCIPCGTIVKISKSLKRITTSDGTVFYRNRRSATWLSNSTWSMVAGHHFSYNPSF